MHVNCPIAFKEVAKARMALVKSVTCSPKAAKMTDYTIAQNLQKQKQTTAKDAVRFTPFKR